tara:strand:+ start:833 stop:1018 length:186 start_codon:yes stop_codon:yes gene_type:complete
LNYLIASISPWGTRKNPSDCFAQCLNALDNSANVGSKRAIEANNGILEREENGQRWYWIEL